MTYEEMNGIKKDLIQSVTAAIPEEYVPLAISQVMAWWERHIQQLGVQFSFSKIELDNLRGDQEGYINHGKQRMFHNLGMALNRPQVCEAKFLPDEYRDAEGRVITRRPDADYAATLEARVFVLTTGPIPRANIGPMQGRDT